MKAVAVPYIIALILGVAVIGLVGYWFVSTGGKFGGQSAITICENKFLQYCIGKDGGETYLNFASKSEECKSVTISYTKCSDIIGARESAQSSGEGETGSGRGSICDGGQQDCRGLTRTDCSFCGEGRWVCRNDKCTSD